MKISIMTIIFSVLLIAGLFFTINIILSRISYNVLVDDRTLLTRTFDSKLHPLGQFLMELSEKYPVTIVSAHISRDNPHLAQFLAYCPNHEPVGYINELAINARVFSAEETEDCDNYFNVVKADLEGSIRMDYFLNNISKMSGFFLFLAAFAGLALEFSESRKERAAHPG